MRNQFFYAFPEGAYFIFIVLLIIGLYLSLAMHRKKILNHLASQHLLDATMHKRTVFNFYAKVFFVSCAWVLATVALMDPKGNARYPEELEKQMSPKEQLSLKKSPHEVIFMIDASASMDVKDMRTGESRLNFAKEIADQIARHLNGESITVYTFTSEGEKIVPSTMDSIFTRLLIKNININEGGIAGTDLYHSLSDVMKNYSASVDANPKTIIIISDGEDLNYENSNDVKRKEWNQNLKGLIGDPKQKNLKIFSIGVGTSEGGVVPNVIYKGKPVHSSLQSAPLKIIGKEGGGRYIEANTFTARSIAETIVKEMAPENPYIKPYESESSIGLHHAEDDFIYDLYYKYPLGIAMLFIAMFLILPENWQRERDR